MVFNAIFMVIIQVLLAGIAGWAVGMTGEGAFAVFAGENLLLKKLLLLLIPWLAGVLCFLAGYRMRPLPLRKNLPAVMGLTILVLLLGIVPEMLFPLQALALPFLPLVFVLNFGFCWPWQGILALLAPLLALAGNQIALGKQGEKRGVAIGILVFYLLLLVLLPVVGVVQTL